MAYAGDFAAVLHMRPWDIDRLTPAQFDYYCQYLDAMRKATDGG